MILIQILHYEENAPVEPGQVQKQHTGSRRADTWVADTLSKIFLFVLCFAKLVVPGMDM
jgi:hypothetical protein